MPRRPHDLRLEHTVHPARAGRRRRPPRCKSPLCERPDQCVQCKLRVRSHRHRVIPPVAYPMRPQLRRGKANRRRHRIEAYLFESRIRDLLGMQFNLTRRNQPDWDKGGRQSCLRGGFPLSPTGGPCHPHATWKTTKSEVVRYRSRDGSSRSLSKSAVPEASGATTQVAPTL